MIILIFFYVIDLELLLFVFALSIYIKTVMK